MWVYGHLSAESYKTVLKTRDRTGKEGSFMTLFNDLVITAVVAVDISSEFVVQGLVIGLMVKRVNDEREARALEFIVISLNKKWVRQCESSS